MDGEVQPEAAVVWLRSTFWMLEAVSKLQTYSILSCLLLESIRISGVVCK